MPIGIYLPPGHDTTNRTYPVMYLLHGAAGYYAEWVDFGAAVAADSLISNALAPPFIMVFPQGDQSYWFNHPQGGEAWADYVTGEVVPWVDAFYPTLRFRNGRAIGGLSMGAVGALQIGLRRPDLFGTIGSHSPSFRNRADNEIFWYLANSVHYTAYDPFALVLTSAAKNRSKLWIDVGDKDPWRPRATEFHNALRVRGWAHQWTVGSGIHEGSYWASRMPEYLSFYAYSLSQPGEAAP
jgi:enterochelin esterase-like enzyme